MEKLRQKMTFAFICIVTFMLHTLVCGVRIQFESSSKQANTLIVHDTNVSLTCVAGDLNETVYWSIDSKQKSNCSVTNDYCIPNATDSGLYKYSSDRSRKEYYLTIPTVPFESDLDKATEFKCSQRTDEETVNLTFAKVEDKNPVITYDPVTRVITAATDCVYPISGITIKWFSCKGSVETPLSPAFTIGKNESGCSGKGDARVSAYMQYVAVEGSQPVELKIVVSNAAGRINTPDKYFRLRGTTFMIEGGNNSITRDINIMHSSSTTSNTFSGAAIAGIIIGVIFVIFITIICVVFRRQT